MSREEWLDGEPEPEDAETSDEILDAEEVERIGHETLSQFTDVASWASPTRPVNVLDFVRLIASHHAQAAKIQCLNGLRQDPSQRAAVPPPPPAPHRPRPDRLY